MSRPNRNHPNKTPEKAPLSLWKSIVLIIVLSFAIVGLFGAMIYVFISGVQLMGLSTPGYIAIFVVISGIFAWLVKRISDTLSGMSHRWFPEESNEQD